LRWSAGLIVSRRYDVPKPVVYLYLDKLSNAFSRWGRSGRRGRAAEQRQVKEAAE